MGKATGMENRILRAEPWQQSAQQKRVAETLFYWDFPGGPVVKTLCYQSSDEMDLHLVMCLTKPRITYNGKSSALK